MGIGVQLSKWFGPERSEEGVHAGRGEAVVARLGALRPRGGDKESICLGGWW